MSTAMMFFWLLGGLLVVSSLAVVFLRNVVYNAIALVAALFLMAVLFLTLHAPMVGVLQILVYAGAIMVLFLFVIMFLNPTAIEPRRGLWWGFGAGAALLLAWGLLVLLSGHEAPAGPALETAIFGSPVTLAKTLFTDFVLPFEIASVLLLVAIIGAVVLAKRGP